MSGVRHGFAAESCADLTALCGRFSAKQLQSPACSTVPLIDLVYQGGAAWGQFLQTLGAPLDCAVAFECGVPSPKPKGRASQTDAVFASDSTVWAMEAKWTEPKDGLTVAKWIKKRESSRADPRATVAGWLAYLRPTGDAPLNVEDFSGFGYQMVHRAASAAWLAERRGLKAELVYLHFVPSLSKGAAATGYYVDQLTQLQARLGGTSTLAMRVVEVSLGFTPEYEAIRHLDKRSPETAARVKAALCAGPLFTFSGLRTIAI